MNSRIIDIKMAEEYLQNQPGQGQSEQGQSEQGPSAVINHLPDTIKWAIKTSLVKGSFVKKYIVHCLSGKKIDEEMFKQYFPNEEYDREMIEGLPMKDLTLLFSDMFDTYDSTFYDIVVTLRYADKIKQKYDDTNFMKCYIHHKINHVVTKCITKSIDHAATARISAIAGMRRENYILRRCIKIFPRLYLAKMGCRLALEVDHEGTTATHIEYGYNVDVASLISTYICSMLVAINSCRCVETCKCKLPGNIPKPAIYIPIIN